MGDAEAELEEGGDGARWTECQFEEEEYEPWCSCAFADGTWWYWLAEDLEFCTCTSIVDETFQPADPAVRISGFPCYDWVPSSTRTASIRVPPDSHTLSPSVHFEAIIFCKLAGLRTIRRRYRATSEEEHGREQ